MPREDREHRREHRRRRHKEDGGGGEDGEGKEERRRRRRREKAAAAAAAAAGENEAAAHDDDDDVEAGIEAGVVVGNGRDGTAGGGKRRGGGRRRRGEGEGDRRGEYANGRHGGHDDDDDDDDNDAASGRAPVPPPPDDVDDDTRILLRLCEAARPDDLHSWEAVRRHLRSRSASDARRAAGVLGDYDATPLHLACRNRPPPDVVSVLLTLRPETASLVDSFGWLPLHYACANEASIEVMAQLVSRNLDATETPDKRGRTPLHFALGHVDRPADMDVVNLLGGGGAVLMADENGMLPLHYACAYGATEQALRVLIEGNIRTITAKDNRGRTPLHFALGNADRPASPGVVSILLSEDRSVVNIIDNEGNLPIHLLSTCAKAIKVEEKDKCDYCQECFSLYLSAHPRAEGHLLMGLQSLPSWLRDYAVLSPVVQKILNVKIATRFPTAVTLMDFFFYVIIIIFFQMTVIMSIEDRTHTSSSVKKLNKAYLIPLLLASIYFFIREVVQMLSLAKIGQFKAWVSSLENWLETFNALLVMFWSIVMAVEALPIKIFQPAAALSMAVFWVMVLNFLQTIIVGFAVFVRGVSYVTKRLAAFLVSLVIILFAFTQIFTTLYQQTEECIAATYLTRYPLSTTICEAGFPVDTTTCEYDESCEPFQMFPWCSFVPAFMRSFTMLLGEVYDGNFLGYKLATFFYGLFMFACVIVLANVLIAVVVDTYRVISDERAALVFWSNRLDFVADMDVIVNFLPGSEMWYSHSQSEDDSTAKLWKKLMYLFDDDIDDHGALSIEYLVYNILRFLTACVAIPLWIIIGLCTFGMLWPPQVREFLLTSQMSSPNEIASEEWTRMNKIKKLNEDVSYFKEEMTADMEKARLELNIIRTVLHNTKTDIQEEMGNVKEIVTELFEILSGE